MVNDLHERVARLLMGGTYSDEQAATQIAMAQYGAIAALQHVEQALRRARAARIESAAAHEVLSAVLKAIGAEQ